jgi:hypothetical protein
LDLRTASLISSTGTPSIHFQRPLRTAKTPSALWTIMSSRPLAGGSPSRDVESLLLHSEQVRMGKECGTVSEQFFSQQYTPMIPILKDNIQNPKNIISEVAAPGWIHGGIPSRSYLRDVNC